MQETENPQFGEYFCSFCGNNWQRYQTEDIECESCGNLREEDISFRQIEKPEPQDIIDTWLDIGQRNSWISQAWDPPFIRSSFSRCESVEELKEKLERGNWCLGQAFYYENICLINQINGGDEWRVIRDGIAFESITARAIIRDGEFDKFVTDVLKATPEQLRRLEYRGI